MIARTASGPTTVVVASEVRLYRDGVADFLERSGFAVVGRAADGPSAIELVRALRPDVALIDVVRDDSLGAVRAIARSAPDVAIVALSVPEREREVIEFAEAGVAGYVTRDDGLEELVAAIGGALRGEVMCSPQLAGALLRRVTALASGADPASREAPLTPREVEIVELIEAGLSNKQIAQRLRIQLATVKNHVHNILEKLGATRRAEAVARARTRGLVSGKN